MPRLVLPKIEFRLIVSIVLLTTTCTPSLPLKAMTFGAFVADPPIILLSQSNVMSTPLAELPRLALPVTSVPMRLPWTAFALAPYAPPSMVMPSSYPYEGVVGMVPLDEIRLPRRRPSRRWYWTARR